MIDAVVGLGANLGQATLTLVAAVESLAQRAAVMRVSPLYQTQALGGPAQPDYNNAAVRVCYPGDSGALLAVLMDIEQQHGRKRDQRWGPRTLDLDLLWVLGVKLDSPTLTVPHPRLTERAFALLPLVSVAPEARDPHSQRLYAEVALQVGLAGVEIVSDVQWDSLLERVSSGSPP